jgi:outer membrane immunogenic protein
MSVSRHAFSLGSALVVGSTTFSAEVHAQAANWTFSYVGAVAGYDWNDIDVQGLGTINADGFAGGAVGGINFYQSGNLVLGVEADIMWIDGSGSIGQLLSRGSIQPCTTANLARSTAVSADVNWKASLRGRAGYLATPLTLVYATAGIAWADVDIAAQGTCLGSDSLNYFGGVFGGGIETSLGANFYGRVEVLHYVFGDERFSADNPRPEQTVSTSVDLDETVARAALVFRLN